MTSVCDVCYGVIYVDCNTSLANGSWVFSLYAIVWDINILVRNSKVESWFRNTKQIVARRWLVKEYTQIKDLIVQMVYILMTYKQHYNITLQWMQRKR